MDSNWRLVPSELAWSFYCFWSDSDTKRRNDSCLVKDVDKLRSQLKFYPYLPLFLSLTSFLSLSFSNSILLFLSLLSFLSISSFHLFLSLSSFHSLSLTPFFSFSLLFTPFLSISSFPSRNNVLSSSLTNAHRTLKLYFQKTFQSFFFLFGSKISFSNLSHSMYLCNTCKSIKARIFKYFSTLSKKMHDWLFFSLFFFIVTLPIATNLSKMLCIFFYSIHAKSLVCTFFFRSCLSLTINLSKGLSIYWFSLSLFPFLIHYSVGSFGFSLSHLHKSFLYLFCFSLFLRLPSISLFSFDHIKCVRKSHSFSVFSFLFRINRISLSWCFLILKFSISFYPSSNAQEEVQMV